MDPLLLPEKFGEFNGNDKGHKLVPWMSWDEWDSVRNSLFSGLPESVASALSRIKTWGSRGCLPIAIEVTALFVKIQQKDPSIRLDLSSSVSDSEDLAMLYSQAVTRLVNGLVDKTRGRTKVSLAEAAAAIDMPRMLIDIRHEACHRDPPSLPLLRQAAPEAIDWLKSYYWDAQKNSIPFKHGESAKIKEEIRSRLQELSFGMKRKQNLGSSPQVSRKRSRKQITRILKNLVRLYAFFSAEFVSVLLENLLGIKNPVDMMESQEKFRLGLSIDDMRGIFDKWEVVISKISEMEPELLLNLLTSVLDMIDARSRLKEDAGQNHLSLLSYDAEDHHVQLLSSIFSRLLEILCQLKQSDEADIDTYSSSVLPKTILFELLRRCLLISEPGNDTLFNSALTLAHLIGDARTTERLKKLSVVFSTSSLDLTEDDGSCDVSLESIISSHDKELQKVTRNVGGLKSKLGKGRNDGSPLELPSGNALATGNWSIAESWKPCPIGMLPRRLGSSGCLPVLNWDVRHCGGKRGAIVELVELDTTCAKRVRENEDKPDDTNDGCLMINGIMQKVSEDEIKKIQSSFQTLLRKSCRVN